MRSLMPAIVTSAVILTPALADPLRDMAAQSFGPLPAVEAVDPQAAELGRALFFDVRLSDTGTLSCATCHNPALGGSDGLPTATGHDWQSAPRNVSTVLNAVLNSSHSWDPVEGAASPSLSGLRSMGAEVALAAAPDLGSGPLSLESAAVALDAYLATLITPAPFDAWLAGDDTALSPEARTGLQLFMERGCSLCHYGVTIGGDGYYPFGLVQAPETAAGAVSGPEAGDLRTAPLRNVARTSPYFHSGAVADLGDAVALMSESQLGMPLAPEETAAIVAFLQSLSGDS